MPEDKIYCGNCKAELSPSARACPSCGCDPKKAVNYCPNCGEAKVNPNAIICTKCGASLTGGSSGPKASAPAAKIFCGNCREELSAAAHACPKCGSDPKKAVNYCTNCGEKKASETAIICTKCGASLKGGSSRLSVGTSSTDMAPEIAAILGLIWGIGLYLIVPEEKKQKAIYLVVGLVIADIICIAGSFVCGLLSYLVIPLCFVCIFVLLIFALHIGAAIVTYNEAITMNGEKPLFDWSPFNYF